MTNCSSVFSHTDTSFSIFFFRFCPRNVLLLVASWLPELLSAVCAGLVSASFASWVLLVTSWFIISPVLFYFILVFKLSILSSCFWYCGLSNSEIALHFRTFPSPLSVLFPHVPFTSAVKTKAHRTPIIHSFCCMFISPLWMLLPFLLPSFYSLPLNFPSTYSVLICYSFRLWSLNVQFSYFLTNYTCHILFSLLFYSPSNLCRCCLIILVCTLISVIFPFLLVSSLCTLIVFLSSFDSVSFPTSAFTTPPSYGFLLIYLPLFARTRFANGLLSCFCLPSRCASLSCSSVPPHSLSSYFLLAFFICTLTSVLAHSIAMSPIQSPFLARSLTTNSQLHH